MSDINPQTLLQEVFGFPEFRPGQKAVMSALWRKRAALAVFPTGGGKSLCYQLPALAFEGVTVVVSPLIALMKDQIDYLRSRGVAASRLDSSLTAEEARQVNEALSNGTLRLLYVAPERFNNEKFLAQIARIKVALFAVDEAHCISEWGHNFRPDYLKLADTARDLGVERILALTATATPSVVADICTAFRIPPECAIVTGFYRPNLNLSVQPVRAEDRDALLLKRLQTRQPGPTIVYVTLQKTAERVAAALQQAGFSAWAYHAGMEAEARNRVQEDWMASDRGIVVATIAFGMGIDKADVRYVYHYNLPKGLESYCQEIGRAGRDGERSTVELLACPDDVPTLENFAYGDTPTERALRALVTELLAYENASFDVSQYDLSNRHDVRPLVLRTVLTYLELMGVLQQGTPFYAGYEIRLLKPLPEILAEFPGKPGQFLTDLFNHAKKGRTWYSLNPDTAAEALEQERKRIVRALEVLEERGLAELRLSDVRQRYTRLREHEDPEALVTELTARFQRREAQDIQRVQDILALVTHNGCLTNHLIRYFGEPRTEPCGHCTWCLTQRAQTLPALYPSPPLPTGLDVAVFRQLRAEHAHALGHPRQAARFLCGLTSPATIQARLSRNPLFGILDSRRFQEVLGWCESEREES
ncbi:MAG TPA: ATP-dependent DNA helicase RecQ [Chthonomonadaceae bacterium]|nr:ATP-dependent DNA helicase RecQ [Chthonomonadaceae bacterium]